MRQTMRCFTTAVMVLMLTGCSMRPQVLDFTEGYRAALGHAATGAVGSEQAIERFKRFMSSLSESSIRAEATRIYAPDAYLNDNLKEVHGAEAIADHLSGSIAGLSRIEVEFHDTLRSGPDWYLRWTMSTTFRSLRGGATVITSGMSHVRFDDQERVLVHRDFWDAASGFYEHVPALGAGVRFVKRRL